MKKIFTLILGCVILSSGIAQVGKDQVHLEGITGSTSYRIEAEFYDGQKMFFGRSKTYVEKIFPQVKGMKLDKDEKSLVFRVLIHEPVDVTKLKSAEIYTEETYKYEAIRPLPVMGSTQKYFGYFLPFTLQVEKDGKVLYSVRAIGDYYQKNLNSNKSNDDIPTGFVINSNFLRSHLPERDVETKNIVQNLKFLQVHFEKLR